MTTDAALLLLLGFGVAWLKLAEILPELTPGLRVLLIFGGPMVIIGATAIAWERYSKSARARKKRLKTIQEIPISLLAKDSHSIAMGFDPDLRIPVYLPDSIRTKHVHILGATGSGKTESVILNFLKQDVERRIGSIILDAKGDASFLRFLKRNVPKRRLRVFDLANEESLSYDPLSTGSALESAQRLFSSLKWSEEYYKSKSFSALQKLFEAHRARLDCNPKLAELNLYLEDADTFAATVSDHTYPQDSAKRDFSDISGLRDQIRTLTLGHLSKILSPDTRGAIDLEAAAKGHVIYFRLQSLMSPQLVSTVGKLIINHLNFLAGTAHRKENVRSSRKLIPVYLDEFASFACPEFADLISKARSAGMALHFSHQSVGDLVEVSPGFLNRITDCSATKIVLRVNDPDTADFFARSYGTRVHYALTHRVTGAKDMHSTKLEDEGSQRETHQFRAHPDVFKGLPTGVASVLIAHGFKTPHGASSVFRIQFPKMKEETRR